MSAFSRLLGCDCAERTGKEIHREPQTGRRSANECNGKLQFDAIETMWDWLSYNQDLGMPGEDAQASLEISSMSHIIDDQESLDKPKIPDPKNDYRAKSAMETTKILIDHLAKEKFLYDNGIAIHRSVGELRGVDKLLMDTVVDKESASSKC